MPVEIGPVIKVEGEAQYRQQIQNLIATTKAYDAEMKKLESSFDSQTSEMEKSAQKQQLLNQQIDAQKAKVAELEAMTKRSAEAKGEDATETMKWRQALANAQTELNRLNGELKNLPNQMQIAGKAMQETGEKISAAGQKISSVGQTMTKAITLPIVGLGTAAIKTAADFDTSMSKVAAVSGASGSDFDALRDKAREMGAQTKFSASEAADAMNYMAMAGWKTEDMLNGVEGIMNLAAASGADLATTSDIVTDALTAFGRSAEDSGRLADIMAAASSNANTNVEMMGETFKYAAPVAGALGFTMEDTAIAIGLMANAGIKASSAGTALRTGMTNLVKPTKQMQTAMKKYGIEVTNTDGSMKSMREITDMLRKKLGGLDEAEQAAAAGAIFGKNAMAGWLAIINGSDKDVEKLTKAVDESAGTAEEMAEVMQDNLSGQLTILKSQVQELGISFGDLLVPYVRKGVTAIQGAVDKLNAMDDSQRNAIIRMGLFAAAAGPVTTAVGKVTEAVGGAVTGIGKFVELAGTSGTFANTLVTNFGSIATGVGLITTAVTVGIGLYKAYQDSAQGAAAEAEKSWKALDQQHAANATAIADAETLAARVQELAAKEELSAAEKDELRDAVIKLNGVMPDLNLQIDKNTGNLDDNSKAILTNIDASLRQYKIEKNKEELIEITEAYAEAEEKLAKAQEERARAEKRTAADYGGDLQARTDDINRLKGAEDSLSKTMTDLGNRYTELTSVNQELTLAQQEEAAASDQVTVSSEEAAAALDVLGTEATESAAEEISAEEARAQAYQEAREKIAESISSQVGLFDELNISATLSKEKMAENLASQAEAYNSYTANLQRASQLAEQDTTGAMNAILQSIAEMGIDGAGYLETLVAAADANDGSLEAILANFGSAETAKKTLVSQLAEMSTGGVAAVEGLTEGVQEQVGPAEDAGSDVVQGVANEIKGGTPNVSNATNAVSTAAGRITSKLNTVAANAKSAASKIPSGIATGIRSGINDVSSAGESLASAAGKALGGVGALYNAYYNYGSHLGQGFADGIRSQAGNVSSAAQTLASEASKKLHHSTPDEGPLHGDDKWGAEMALQFAKSMLSGRRAVAQAARTIAGAAVFLPRNDGTTLGDLAQVTRESQNIDPAAIYAAVRAGAEAGQKPVVINEKAFKRALVSMGVAMA